MFRFSLVGLVSEGLYLGLYALVLKLSGVVSVAIAVAGIICLILNAYLHAKISFQISFRRHLLILYIAIQSLCLLISLALGWIMTQLGIADLAIGLITLLVWAGFSFVLTGWVYRYG